MAGCLQLKPPGIAAVVGDIWYPGTTEAVEIVAERLVMWRETLRQWRKVHARV